MPFMSSFSIKSRLLGLYVLLIISFALMTAVVFDRQHRYWLRQVQDALAEGNRHIIAGVMKNQDQRLEKQLLKIIAVEELSRFLKDPQNAEARQIVQGLFLTMKTGGIVRFSVYDLAHNIILQETDGDLPRRAAKLPPALDAIYDESRHTLSIRTYFRGGETSATLFPAEYCGMTTITDDDSQPLGFVELAAASELWLGEMAANTRSAVGLYDASHSRFSGSTEPGLFSQLESGGFELDGRSATLITAVGGRSYQSLLIDLPGADHQPAA